MLLGCLGCLKSDGDRKATLVTALCSRSWAWLQYQNDRSFPGGAGLRTAVPVSRTKEDLDTHLASGSSPALMLVIALSWSVVVDLTPASQRPYVGSSQDNSEISLALGYNGIQRLVGNFLEAEENKHESTGTQTPARLPRATGQPTTGNALPLVSPGREIRRM